MEPILACFTDPENRIRYFSAECLYNIAKVSKGEILVYFNPIFDALSKVRLSASISSISASLIRTYKLAADSEMSVKNGAELLDRLLKDIVAESASVYIPQYPETEKIRQLADEASTSILVPHPDDIANGEDYQGARKAFSLARFIPLLSERIYVVSPFTRSFLVSWITVLDSVPELELITYLPEFLDGLLWVTSILVEQLLLTGLVASISRTLQKMCESQPRTSWPTSFVRSGTLHPCASVQRNKPSLDGTSISWTKISRHQEKRRRSWTMHHNPSSSRTCRLG